MREDKKRRKKNLMSSLFSDYCIPLHLTQDQAIGHVAHSVRQKASAKTTPAHTRLKGVPTSLFVWNTVRDLYFGAMLLRAVEKEEPIQSLYNKIITLRSSHLSLILHPRYKLAETFLVHL